MRLGRNDEAQEDFRRAAELDPSLREKLKALIGESETPERKP
jgi:hypothetical protein